MIELVQFEPNDIAESEVGALGEFYKQAGPAYSALQDGKVIASAGLIVDDKTKTGHGWGVITDAARAKPFFLHRLTSRLLAVESAERHLEKVTIMVDANFEKGKVWVERMGFKPEKTLILYSRRSDGE